MNNFLMILLDMFSEQKTIGRVVIYVCIGVVMIALASIVLIIILRKRKPSK